MQQAEIERLLGRPPRITFDDVVRHPQLPIARKAFLDHFLEVYGDDPFLVRLLIESGRFFIYQMTVVLEAAQDPARRETWLTVGLVKQTLAQYGLASERQTDHLIGRLCSVGYMEMVPSDHDRRVRILKPTEKMQAHDREWLAAHHAGLAVLYPQHDYGLALRRDREFQAVQRRIGVAFLPLGAKLYLSVPDMLLFLNRAGGYMVLAALLQAAMEAPDDPHAPVPYADVGDRFGVSRTHVRQLLADAEEAGLVRLRARGGHRVEILPRLWASHDQGIAGGMYLHDMLYLAVTNRMNARRVSAAVA